jgi:hypothetical protein
MPARLAAVKTADPSVDVIRVWTTLCCVSSLQRLNVSWIWGDGDLYAEREQTIVDAGRLYVEKLAQEKPALAEALATGAVRMAAKRTTRLWKRACEMRVAELRRGEPMTSQMAISHVHRTGTELTRAIVVGVRCVGCHTRLPPALTCTLPAAAALYLLRLPLRAVGRPAALAECVAHVPPGLSKAR